MSEQSGQPMTTEHLSLPRIESSQPFRGFLGMLSVELRVWFPWRVGMLILGGLGVFATCKAVLESEHSRNARAVQIHVH